jgi:type I restriction enzyme S subunit
MEVMPGYKLTEVGVIPEAWEVRQVGELCEYQNGTALEHLFTADDGLKVISIGNYSVTGSYIDNGVHINRKYRREVEKFILMRNDLTISLNDKTSVGAIIGRVLLIPEDDLFVFNQRTMRLRPKSNVSPSYLHFLINAERVHGTIVGLAKPGTQIYVNTDDVIELKLPVPPLTEQRAIAAVLSDVDALLDSIDRLIAKKRNLKQAAMQQLLTGQTRLPGFSGNWDVKKLSDVSWFQEGPGVRNSQFTSSGVKLLNGTNIFRGELNLDTTTRFISKSEAHGAYAHFLADDGDIVLASSGITIEKLHEKVAFVKMDDLPFCMNTSTIRFKAITQFVTSGFLFHFLTGNEFKAMIGSIATGSAQLNFGPFHLAKVNISIPPIDEQFAISNILSELDEELVALEKQRNKTAALKQGMMQELLTGRTRLV